MRIGIDARFHNESGLGRYIRNLLQHLQIIDTENDYFIFLLPKDLPQVTLSSNFHAVEADFLWYGFSEQLKFPRLLNKYNLDVLHIPHFNIPIFYSGKFIVTIHDLIHQKFNNSEATLHQPLIFHLKQQAYKKVFSQAVKKSQRVITVSEFVKQELEHIWQVESKKIIVTPEAVENELLTSIKQLSDSDSKRVLTKFGIRQPFLFYVGNAYPHKNLSRLIEAFLKIRPEYQYLQLVLSGKDHAFWQKLKTKYSHRDIIYTGFITDKEMISLYKLAKAFVLPSLEEGFGIPVLEAMACQCPVVASSAASLPEVGGDACLYFDPRDTTDLAKKLNLILQNNKLTQNLVQEGDKQYRKFSWEKLAQKTLAIYEETKS